VACGTVSSLFYIFTINEPKLTQAAKQQQKEFKKTQSVLFKAERKESKAK
jgi:hypothetical protein